ncbi:MAG: protein-glutamate O-methyltransferase CheR [Azonexus sp.]|jgi:chemotaxis protein methyltransferase CheR|nr:protein-glutamate O-methyltransferase CheR [Azonexus sp.]
MSESPPITDQEFALFRDLIYQITGISLSDAKKVLVVGRLARRLQFYQLGSFLDYYRLVTGGQYPNERQIMVDLLTTNETYFFREPKHFDFLRDQILKKRNGNGVFRIWSAACSSGEEVYTLAMTLAENLLGVPWEVLGSDISTRVLEKAAAGHYSLARTEGIPPGFMSKYCLKGVRSQAGTFLIAPEIRRNTRFCQINLMQPVETGIGQFEAIFLRNVMIYFDAPTKTKVVHNLLTRLKPGGHLFIGHSETLNGITDRVQAVVPTVYRKP